MFSGDNIKTFVAQVRHELLLYLLEYLDLEACTSRSIWTFDVD